MEKIRASLPAEGKKKIIYLGDGTADFCAGLKLEEGDFLMPRKNYPIWEIICTNRSLIKAKVHEWKDGEDLETILLDLINPFFIEEKYNVRSSTDRMVAVECKFLTSSITAHEAFSNSTLPVPQ